MVFRKTRSKPAQGDPVFLVQQIRKPHFSNSRGVWNSGGTPFWGGPDRFLDPSGGGPGSPKPPPGGVQIGPKPPFQMVGFRKIRLKLGNFWVPNHKIRVCARDFQDFSFKNCDFNALWMNFSIKSVKIRIRNVKIDGLTRKIAWNRRVESIFNKN